MNDNDRLQSLSFSTNFYRKPSSNPLDREREGLRMCQAMDELVTSTLLPTSTTGGGTGINFEDITQRINVIMRHVTTVVGAKPPEKYMSTHIFSHIYCHDIHLVDKLVSKVTIHLPGVAACNLQTGRLGPVEHRVNKIQNFFKSDTTFGFLIEKKIYTNIYNLLTGEVGKRLGDLLERNFAAQEQTIMTAMRLEEIQRLYIAILLQLEGVRNAMLRGEFDNLLKALRDASVVASIIIGLSRLPADTHANSGAIAARMVYESVLRTRFILDRSPVYFIEHILDELQRLLSNHYIMKPINSISINSLPVNAILITTRDVKEALNRAGFLKRGQISHSLTRKLLFFSKEQAQMAPFATALPVNESNVVSISSDYVYSRQAKYNDSNVHYMREEDPIYSEDNVPGSYLECGGKMILVESVDENYDQTTKSNPLINKISKTFLVPLGMKITQTSSSLYKPTEHPTYPSSMIVIGDDGSTAQLSLSATASYFALSEFLYMCHDKERNISCNYFPLSTEQHSRYNTSTDDKELLSLAMQQENLMDYKIQKLSEKFYPEMDNLYITERECHPYFDYTPHILDGNAKEQIVFSPRHRLLFGNIPAYVCPISHHISRGVELLAIYSRRVTSLYQCTDKFNINIDDTALAMEVKYMNGRMRMEMSTSGLGGEKDSLSNVAVLATELIPSSILGTRRVDEDTGLVKKYMNFVSSSAIDYYISMPLCRILQKKPPITVTFTVEYDELFLRKNAGVGSSTGIGFSSILLSSIPCPQVHRVFIKGEKYTDDVTYQVSVDALLFGMVHHTNKRDHFYLDLVSRNVKDICNFIKRVKKHNIASVTINKTVQKAFTAMYKLMEDEKTTKYKYEAPLSQESHQGEEKFATEAALTFDSVAELATTSAHRSTYMQLVIHCLLYCVKVISEAADVSEAILDDAVADVNDIVKSLLPKSGMKGFAMLSRHANNFREEYLKTVTDAQTYFTMRRCLVENSSFSEMETTLSNANAKGILNFGQIFAALYSRCQLINPLTVVSCLKNNIGVCVGVCLVKSEEIEAHDGILATPGAYEMYTGPTSTIPHDTNDVSIQTDVRCRYVYTKNVVNHGSLLLRHLMKGQTYTDSSHFNIVNFATSQGTARTVDSIAKLPGCFTFVSKEATEAASGDEKVRNAIRQFLGRVGESKYARTSTNAPIVDGRLLSQANVVLAPCVVSSYFLNKYACLRGFDNLVSSDTPTDTYGDGFYSWNPYSSNICSINNRCFGVLPKELENSHNLTARNLRNHASIFKFFSPFNRNREEMMKSIIHDHRLLKKMADINSVKDTDDGNDSFDDPLLFCKRKAKNSREPLNEDVDLQRVSIPFCYTSVDILKLYKDDLLKESGWRSADTSGSIGVSFMDTHSGSDSLHDITPDINHKHSFYHFFSRQR